MRKYSLICDCCGKEVENLYDINFIATEGSEDDNYYLPDIEICKDCVDKVCDFLGKFIASGNEKFISCNEDCDDCQEYTYNNEEKCYVPDAEDCEELENGTTILTEETLKNALNDLEKLTESFHQVSSNQSTETKNEDKESIKLNKNQLFDLIKLSVKVNGVELNLKDEDKYSIFSTLYNFSHKIYKSETDRKAELYAYLDSLDTQDKKDFATICSYAMATHDRLYKKIWTFI